MAHIYYEKGEIPIPEGASASPASKTVVRWYQGTNGKRNKVTVGKLAPSGKTMFVNDQFRKDFPDVWEKYFGNAELIPSEANLGMYALMIGIAYQRKLYPLLCEVFKPLYTNAIMDFAMYNIAESSCVASFFPEKMKQYMLFSYKPHNDSWLSKLFSREITPEMINQFKIEWLKSCKKNGIESVWLCIDGSNADSDLQNSNIAENRKSKNNQTTKFSYIWAVDAKDGRPVTWCISNGNLHDCKAIDEIIEFIGFSELKIEGFIIDRRFASQDVINKIKELKIDYVVMIKDNTNGYIDIFKKYSDTIKMDVSYLIGYEAVFGITDKCKIFNTSSEESCIGLFFDATYAYETSDMIIRNAERDYRTLRKKINMSEKFDEKYKRPYLKIDTDNDNNIINVSLDTEYLQKEIDKKGFYAIASSKNQTAEEIHRIYHLRDISEKQFSIFKAHLRYNAIQSETDWATYSRMTVAFIASIIRTEIQLACQTLNVDTDVMIHYASKVNACLMPQLRYEFTRKISANFIKLIAQFGLTEKHFSKFVKEINEQVTVRRPMPQVRIVPDVAKPVKEKKSRSKKINQEDSTVLEKRKGGRPKGSKNKKTLERELLQQGQAQESKRKPGRPKGSKNKKTLEREALEQKRQESFNKRKGGGGRPKGSRNKKTLERERLLAEASQQTQSCLPEEADCLDLKNGLGGVVAEVDQQS